MKYFPAVFSAPGDCIAVDSRSYSPGDEKYTNIMKEKEICVIPLIDIQTMVETYGSDNVEFRPWGWNHSLLSTLLSYNVDPRILKTKGEIDHIRRLSHRRTSAKILETILETAESGEIIPPQEVFSVEDALSFLQNEGEAFFKMPWSSSGRGVIYTKPLSLGRITEWLTGAIRRQGSVMAERAYTRTIDFATEWFCRDGEVEFIGLSVFNTSESGRYLGNISAPQGMLWDMVRKATSKWNENVVTKQKLGLSQSIAPFYEGPIGIDMFVTSSGDINPCVEINLRQTMGMVNLKKGNV